MMRRSILATTLAVLSVVACGGPKPVSGPSGPSNMAPPPPSRWQGIFHSFDDDWPPVTLAAYGDRLWVTHHAEVLVFDSTKTKPEKRFEGKISDTYKRRMEGLAGACESNGHAFVVGQSLEVTPAVGVLLHGVASAGPLTPVKTAFKLPPLSSVWCGERVAYAVGENGVLRASTETETSALEWTRVPLDTGKYGANSIHGVAADDVWAVGSEGLIAHGANDTWSKVASGVSVDLLTVRSVGKGEVWAGGRDKVLLHTTDGGKSWTKVTTAAGPIITAVFADASLVLVGDSCGRVLASEDGGAHFTSDGDVGSCTDGGVYSLARRADGTVLAATKKYIFERSRN